MFAVLTFKIDFVAIVSDEILTTNQPLKQNGNDRLVSFYENEN